MTRRVAALVALTLAAGLAGCAHEKPSADAYRWAYLEERGEAPRLAYGRPSSDDVVLMMRCSPGRDRIDVSAVGLTGGELVLASGRTEDRFAGAKVVDAMAEGGLLEAHGQTSAPVLARFRKSGDLALLVEGQRHSLAANSADRGEVQAFFKACGV